MAFTAGSPELTKATQLANDLASLRGAFGTAFVGSTAAQTIESNAANYGFGITGITTGSGFPPFGSFLPSFNNTYPSVTAILQNPRGETMASGFTVGAIEGQTVGIYIKKFINSGEKFTATTRSGVTLALGFTGNGQTLWARGPVSVQFQDQIVFGDGKIFTVGLGGNTAAGAGETAAFRVIETIPNTYATGSAFDVRVIGITRGTNGVAGTTFESYRGTILGGGFTAAIWFNSSTATGNTWAIS